MQFPFPQELPLDAPKEILQQLCKLLDPILVVMHYGDGKSFSFSTAVAVRTLREALAKGYLIDRSNGESSLGEWDGWLIVKEPDRVVWIETTWKTGLV